MTLKLNGSSSGSVSIDAPASTTGGADVTLTLPVNDGDATDGSLKTPLTTDGAVTLLYEPAPVLKLPHNVLGRYKLTALKCGTADVVVCVIFEKYQGAKLKL